MTPKEENGLERSVVEWIESIVFATALLIVVFVFFFRAVTVSGPSMIPTLQSGDKIIVRSIGYTAARGDVVVVDGYNKYGDPLVKRVIGVGGDQVDIDFATGVVTVNGAAIDEPYLGTPTNRAGDVSFPLTVPSGMVFVMGDNRQVSLDSRWQQIGFIDTRDLLGKVIFRVLPFTAIGAIE